MVHEKYKKILKKVLHKNKNMVYNYASLFKRQFAYLIIKRGIKK
jgi:hypothetical protein